MITRCISKERKIKFPTKKHTTTHLGVHIQFSDLDTAWCVSHSQSDDIDRFRPCSDFEGQTVLFSTQQQHCCIKSSILVYPFVGSNSSHTAQRTSFPYTQIHRSQPSKVASTAYLSITAQQQSENCPSIRPCTCILSPYLLSQYN